MSKYEQKFLLQDSSLSTFSPSMMWNTMEPQSRILVQSSQQAKEQALWIKI